MIKKSKLIVASIIATLFLTLVAASGAFADNTVIDPVAAYGGSIDISNSTTTPKSLTNDITITIDGSEDLLAGGCIKISPPSGTYFHIMGTPHLLLNNSSQSLRFGKSSDSSDGPEISGSSFILIGSAGGALASGENVIGELSGGSINLYVTAAPTEASATITIDNDTNNCIALLPTSTSKKNDTQTTGGQLSITTNANTGSANTTTLGTIDLLAPPRIVDAYMVNSTTVNVVFNQSVTSSQQTSWYTVYSSASGAGTNPTSATRSSSDSKIVTLTNSSWSLDFNVDAGNTPTVALSANGVYNASSTDHSITNESTNRHVIRTASDSAISGITLDKTIVSGQSDTRTLSNNKFNITFTGSTNQPVKFKLVRSTATSTTRTPTAPINLDDCTLTISGSTLSSEEILYSGADNSSANNDIYVIPGSSMASGSATVTVALGSSTRDGMTVISGDDDGRNGTTTYTMESPLTGSGETNLVVQASLDEFNTVTTSDAITVDYKAPSVVTSGTDKPQFLDRNRVTMTFNEDMDTANLANPALWSLSTAVNSGGTTYDVSAVDVESDKRTVTLTTVQTLPIGTAMYVNLKSGASATPGSTIEDKYYNPATATAGNSLTTSSIGTTSSGDVSAAEIGNNTAGNSKVSNNSRDLRVTITATTGLSTGNIYMVAVDASNASISNAQGTIQAGSAISTALVESSTGVYQGVYQLNSALDADAIVLWVTTGTSAPTSDSDFADRVESESVEVDNTLPTVQADAELVDSNHVTVLFSKPMNATRANDASYYTVQGESGGSLDVLDVSNVASDKQSVTLQLLQDVEDGVTYFVDVSTNVTDDAGNAFSNANTYGVDRARFTGGETAFGVSATDVNIAPEASFTVTISGGTTPYSIKTESDSTIATATLSDSTLIIEGVANGTTSVVVQDSKTIPSTKTINITVSDAVSASPNTLTINENATETFAVSGGTAPYTIASGDTSVATVDVSELSAAGDVTVTGVAAGTATITVTDADSETATVSVTVQESTTQPPQDPPTDQTTEDKWEIPPEEIASAPVSMGSVTDDGKVESMELSLNFPPYTEAVDIYVLIAIPVAGGWGYFSVKDDGSLVDIVTEGIVAYALNTTEAIDVTIFESFAVCNPFGSAVPEGQWFVFYLIAPANGGDATAALAGNHALHFFGFTVDCE
jgi:hypothetical protein